MAASIAQKFKAQKVDLAVGIATPTAQALVNLLRDQPVIYCAVTDPVDAGLVDSYEKGGANVTADPSSARDILVLAAWGFDYYRMGGTTGRLAAEVLSGKPTAEILTRYMTEAADMDLLVNLDVARHLGLKIPSDLLEKANTRIENGAITEVR